MQSDNYFESLPRLASSPRAAQVELSQRGAGIGQTAQVASDAAALAQVEGLERRAASERRHVGQSPKASEGEAF